MLKKFKIESHVDKDAGKCYANIWKLQDEELVLVFRTPSVFDTCIEAEEGAMRYLSTLTGAQFDAATRQKMDAPY